MRIGCIGAGKMAEAMLTAWIRRGLVRPEEVTASDVSDDRLSAVRAGLGIRAVRDNMETLDSDVIVLAVKPQHLADVFSGLPGDAAAGRMVLSIMAGKRIAGIESALPGARVVRVMPNLPCVVGEGMSAWCAGRGATGADRERVVALLSAFGAAIEVNESQMDAVTALSGSGPAFFAWIMDRLAAGAVAQGLPPDTAMVLARQTMLGTARLLIDRETDPKALIASVASAKGTTAAGLAVLDGSDAGAVLERTIAAAAQRSRELSA